MEVLWDADGVNPPSGVDGHTPVKTLPSRIPLEMLAVNISIYWSASEVRCFINKFVPILQRKKSFNYFQFPTILQAFVHTNLWQFKPTLLS